ncbi:FecR family protein [Sphingobacterium griseoflavum]|uniref:Iron dicitrate transporter FecR n=1 Tax=Sphingobacterium griseoflavum TaxID=1474952 RepID=A0ABQ3HZ09_9SPHI|nr:FecR domain-containing protein [Sphingobacterium griseoflavum]GHE45881.1 iron dicitrate transporter FecR [Sphingobacterium griseoflavum]
MDKKRLDILIDQFHAGDISSEGKKELMEYYNRMQGLTDWDEDLMGDFSETKTRIFENLTPTLADTKKSRTLRLNPMWLRAVAVLAVVVAVSFYMLFDTFNAPKLVAITSGKAMKEVALPDGSKITLNINSKLTYPAEFAEDERVVEFEGEGFFEISSNAKRPFIVKAADMQVKVLGTSFNLKAYAEDAFFETSLIKGKVEIYTTKEQHKLTTLMPNQKFSINKDVLQRASLPDVKSTIEVNAMQFIDEGKTAPVDVAWREGKFAFASMTLEDIAKEIYRRYGVGIEVDNQELAKTRYSGTFTTESIQEVLAALSLVKPFSYRKEGEKIVIY